MSNLTTFHRNLKYRPVAKPPVIKSINKPIAYVRSPSSSRIATNTSNTKSIGNYYPGTNLTSGQPLGLTRKTGSCQNLSGLINPSSTNHHSAMSRNNDEFRSAIVPDKFGSSNAAIGATRSATNNSFSPHQNYSSTITANKSSFYNGYSDSKPIKSRPFIKQPEKSSSSGSSSTNSPEVGANTTSHLLSGSNDRYKTTTGTSGSAANVSTTNVHSSAIKTSVRGDTVNNKYNGDSFPPGLPNRGTPYGTGYAMQRSETTKSLNNSLNEIRGLVGLANLGNTCFMNSILQCLSNCKPLHDHCLSSKYEESLNTKTPGPLFRAYSDLMKSIWRSDSDGYISPDKFKRQFQKVATSFHGTAQQDSQEFLRIMLDVLHQDVNRNSQKDKRIKFSEEEDEKLSEQMLADTYWTRYVTMNNSFIVDIFVGQLKSTLCCKKCGHQSVTFDPFWDLSLPIPKNRRETITLKDCLDLFTSEEVLEGDEMPKCFKCKMKRSSTKCFSIKKFPPILVIHLKRFAGDRLRSKISAFIDFPTRNLNLQEYDADAASQKTNIVYNLCGVSNHSGTVYGGHYTAYCCNPYSRNWYLYNDTRVQRIDESSVCSSEAYVLFYEMSR